MCQRTRSSPTRSLLSRPVVSRADHGNPGQGDPAARVLGNALRAATQALGLDAAETTRALLGTDASDIDSLPTESAPARCALSLVRVYLQLRALVGSDPQNMQHWMRGANKGTGGIPAEQVQTREGLDIVLSYLERF